MNKNYFTFLAQQREKCAYKFYKSEIDGQNLNGNQ